MVPEPLYLRETKKISPGLRIGSTASNQTAQKLVWWEPFPPQLLADSWLKPMTGTMVPRTTKFELEIKLCQPSLMMGMSRVE